MSETTSKMTPAPSITTINQRIVAGNAVVYTAATLLEKYDSENLASAQPDIVTLAFGAPFSGTAAMLCVPVAGRGVFTRAEHIWLNGVPGTPGPAPNERLGEVDTMIYADTGCEDTTFAVDGVALLHDLIKGDEIKVHCESAEGSDHHATTTLQALEFARFYVYNALLDAQLPASVVSALGRGSRILLNGADGIILGTGTRDTDSRRSLSLTADMRSMDAELMVGLDTTSTRHIGNMVAMAIPVLNQSILQGLHEWALIRPVSDSINAAAVQLQERISAATFTLTDTDYPL